MRALRTGSAGAASLLLTLAGLVAVAPLALAYAALWTILVGERRRRRRRG